MSAKQATTKKAKALKTKKADYDKLLVKWKESGAGLGAVDMIQNSPAMRALVGAWPSLDHELDYSKLKRPSKDSGGTGRRLWDCHKTDFVEAARLCGIDPHTVLRVYDKAKQFAIIYPDGTVDVEVEKWFSARHKLKTAKQPGTGTSKKPGRLGF